MHIHIFTGAHAMAHAEEIEAGKTSRFESHHATTAVAIGFMVFASLALAYSVWKTCFPNAFSRPEKIAYSAKTPTGEIRVIDGKKVVVAGKFLFAVDAANRMTNGQSVNIEVAYKATKLGNEQHIDRASVWAIKSAR